MSPIDALLQEDRAFSPPAALARRAHVDADAYQALVAEAEADPEGWWAARAREELVWATPFEEVLDDLEAPFYRWFADGTLNASANCLDRHLPHRADQVAIRWEAEDGKRRDLSYAELHEEVCRFAGVLRGLGVASGDRVVLYMGLVPEVAVAMLACARIGAIHSVVFGGFSAQALADRIEDTGAGVVVTCDGAWRAGKTVPLKANTDDAIRRLPPDQVASVVVLRRTGQDVAMTQGRDLWWHDLAAAAEPVVDPPALGAEHPLFILYTSGSTGKPKGIVHSTAGYLLWARLSTRWVFDLHDDDIYWCTADVGWITGHTYLVYGPLANGATVVMYEGAPTYPEPDRFWDIVRRHGVTVLYTAPTAIRALMRAGDQWPARHDLSSLRVLGTVGEPINPEAWMWYHETIGGGRCPIVDTWWQTETGGIMISPLPGATTTRPGSCTRPLPGIAPAILGEDGQPLGDDEGGYLVMTRPWPSMARGVWGDPDRFRETYWSRFDERTYVAGDTARRDRDGNHWILGRFDDVLNVSGHRIGTMEVESALVAHPAVAEAAVVGAPHEVTGEAIHAFVVTREPVDAAALREHVAQQIGKTARPQQIVFAEALPKTRSGKIMRRLLRAIARGETIDQDTSTLEDPEVVRRLQEAAAVPGQTI
ncbi:MAG: acetate--CoA ligase [Thermoplasmatota archaeon]